MTKEEKDLLVKDLCARVPYKTRVRYTFAFAGASAITEYSSEGILSYEKLQEFSLPNLSLEKRCVAHILPYLRPMSSMTEEEKKEIGELLDASIEIDTDGNISYFSSNDFIPCSDYQIYIDYLISYHFDYRGLIEKGLAIDCTGLNIY